MKLKCLHCENKFDGNISYDKLGWHSVCPECGCSFDVDVPEGKILMVFASREIDFGHIDFAKFEDNHMKNEIYSYRAYNSVKSFMNRWRKMAENPDSMWYWVIDNTTGEYITTGACSIDGDREIFRDYFKRFRYMEQLRETAQWIVEGLETASFNDVTVSSGYFVIKEFKNGTDRAVDVYKSTDGGKPHYVIYCSYEDDCFDYVYTEDLSVESLLNKLEEFYLA